MCRMVVVLVIVGLCVNTAAALPGSGTQQDPWRIKSLVDFDDFAADANYWDGYTRLETDVNLAGLTYTTAVIAPDMDSSTVWFQGTAFTGVFDGNDHKVTGLTIDGGDDKEYLQYLGLFGYLEADSEVKNLGLEDCSIRGKYDVGGMVGRNHRGSISNCYSTGDVNGYGGVGGLVGSNFGSVSNSYSIGDVSAWDSVGGLVGYHHGSISNCYSKGDVSGDRIVGGLVGINFGVVSNCNSISDVIGNDYVGGLVGVNLGPVSNSYSTGEVNGYGAVGGFMGKNEYGTVSNCYSTGSVSGNYWVAGLVGENEYGMVSNSYSTGSVNGVEYVGGLVGINSGPVSNCYSTGDVNGVEYVGGLVGYNSGCALNCFWDTDTQTHGVTESIGYNDGGTATNVAGLPTAQLQTRSTFTDARWDFVNFWDLTCEGMNYPRLIWQITSADFVCPHGVDFRDYSFFANHWRDSECGNDNDCDGADLDFSDKVDWADLKIFCDHWLEGTGH